MRTHREEERREYEGEKKGRKDYRGTHKEEEWKEDKCEVKEEGNVELKARRARKADRKKEKKRKTLKENDERIGKGKANRGKKKKIMAGNKAIRKEVSCCDEKKMLRKCKKERCLVIIGRREMYMMMDIKREKDNENERLNNVN